MANSNNKSRLNVKNKIRLNLGHFAAIIGIISKDKVNSKAKLPEKEKLDAVGSTQKHIAFVPQYGKSEKRISNNVVCVKTRIIIKKQYGKANKRNKARRKIKEAIRLYAKQLIEEMDRDNPSSQEKAVKSQCQNQVKSNLGIIIIPHQTALITSIKELIDNVGTLNKAILNYQSQKQSNYNLAKGLKNK